jgi:limonene-1,2-epoxide hydrolase
MDPVVGDGPIREFMKGFLGMAQAIEFRVHFDAENSAGVVMNERTDRFQVNGTWVELPVMGVFELSGGKISRWRDYFDANQFNTQLAKATKQ